MLRALEIETGFRPEDADVIIGSSAGSVVGAYLRSGMTTEDMWLLARGLHPTHKSFGGSGDDKPALFVPTFSNPFEIVRHMIGSSYVLARALSPFPLRPPAFLKAAFPGGLFAMAEGEQRFAEELPAEWPDKDLWLTTIDIVSGRRIVLGRQGSPRVDLPRAVLASAAIPGVYPPVQVGRRSLIDGGTQSTSNLDLAVQYGADRIIAVVPMAFDTVEPPGVLGRLMRQIPARRLSSEVALANRRGIEVLMFRPSAAEVSSHSMNLMRSAGLEKIAESAFEETLKALKNERFASLFAA